MRRILIIDDEIPVLNALRRTLRMGFAETVLIETFGDPEAALMRAGEQDFDVVIADFRMPGLNGADVLRLIKGLQPDALRIMVSATTRSIDIMAAVNQAEVFRYLVKPWQEEDLIALVQEAFDRRDSQAGTKPDRSAAQALPGAAGGQPHERRQPEQEESGITRVNWDEHGNVRLL